MNPSRIRGGQPGQEVYSGFPQGTLRVLVVQQEEEGTFIGECGLPSQDDPYWTVPAILQRVSAEYLFAYRKIGIIDEAGQFRPAK